VGDTPLIRLRGLEDEVGNTRVELYAKAEWFNPSGSVKDRAALRIVSDAEKAGLLTKEKTILESTSGNTGIALAMIGAAIWGVLEVGRKLDSGLVVTVLPDAGSRYLRVRF
jgi:cysteine synthase B